MRSRWLLTSLLLLFGCDNGGEPADVAVTATASSSAIATTTSSPTAKPTATPRWWPTPTKLATGQNHPLDLRVDADNIYWINHGKLWGEDQQLGQAAVMKRAKSGGAPVALARGRDMITGIAIEDGKVYWTESDGVYQVSAAGGALKQLHHAEKGDGMPMIIGVQDGIAYVGITHMQLGGLYVITPSKRGAHPYTTGFFGVHGMAFDSGGIYLCVGPTGTMLGYSPIGGEDRILAKKLRDCSGLAYSDEHLYWTETRGGTIRTMKSSGGTPTTLASDQKEPWGITVHGGWVYWTDREGKAVRRIKTSGGEVETIAKAIPKPQGIAVDAQAVYWAAPEDGSVYRVELAAGSGGRAPSASTEPAAEPPRGDVPSTLGPESVPAGHPPGEKLWLPAYRVQRFDGDAGKSYLDGQAACASHSMSLCTERQWARACSQQPKLAAIESWTLTPEGDGGFVVRGGGTCSDRKVSGGAASAGRAGVCCERTIAVTSKNENTAFLETTARLLLAFEKAVSSRRSDAVAEHLAASVAFNGKDFDHAGMVDLYGKYFRQHPDSWTAFDSCKIDLDTAADTWTASCHAVMRRDDKIAYLIHEYVWDGTARKVARFTEGEVFRKYAAP